ncbi:hypothetical protein [Actinomadura luteofluorescens]
MIKRRMKAAVVAITAVPLISGVVSISATPAQAAVKCGDNITTYQSPPPVSQTQQRLTYVNCSGRTLNRKADIAWAADGECKRIGPWATVSLARNVLKKVPVHIKGSKRC